MKKYTAIILLALFFGSCSQKKQEPYISSYEIHATDTINRIDSEGRKQGKWITGMGTDSARTTHYFNGHVLSSY